MHSENWEQYKIILVGAGILAVIVTYFVVAIIRQQSKVSKWQQARISAEITTLENERKRIAGDLHDEIGPMLSAVKLQINHLEPVDETEQVVLSKSSHQIDQIIQRFRDISYDLLPNTLVRKGLVRGAEEFIHRMKEADRLEIVFSSGELGLKKEKEINVYRIIQEIVHNTIKHARAKILKIDLVERNGIVFLHSTDDGIGFKYEEKAQHGSGLGLLNLQSRVEVLKGKLDVRTAPGLGTSYFIEFPA